MFVFVCIRGCEGPETGREKEREIYLQNERGGRNERERQTDRKSGTEEEREINRKTVGDRKRW